MAERDMSVRDVSSDWLNALSQYTPAGGELLEVLQGMILAVAMGEEAEVQKALQVLDRLRGMAPDEYTLGAIAMMMSVCQMDTLSPQEAVGFLENQLDRWHGEE